DDLGGTERVAHKVGSPLAAHFRDEEIDVDGRAFPRQHRLDVVERWLPGDELIEHQAERVDVAGGHDVGGVLPDGRGDVPAVEMAADRMGDAEVRGVRDERQVEVPQLDDPAPADGDVAGAGSSSWGTST